MKMNTLGSLAPTPVLICLFPPTFVGNHFLLLNLCVFLVSVSVNARKYKHVSISPSFLQQNVSYSVTNSCLPLRHCLEGFLILFRGCRILRSVAEPWFYNQFPFVGHVSCFQVVTVTNNSVINNQIHYFLSCAAISLR